MGPNDLSAMGFLSLVDGVLEFSDSQFEDCF